VASRKFSVEEITALRKEVDHWLSEVTAAASLTLPHPQSTALTLSSLLLKTILNASKAAKNTETKLKIKVDKLELELHK
jgi:hypothetical protein